MQQNQTEIAAISKLSKFNAKTTGLLLCSIPIIAASLLFCLDPNDAKKGVLEVPKRLSNGLTHIGEAALIFYKSAFFGHEFDLSGNLVGETFGVGLSNESTQVKTISEDRHHFCKLAWGLDQSQYESFSLKTGALKDVLIQAVPRSSQFSYEFVVAQPEMNRFVKVASFSTSEEAIQYQTENKDLYSNQTTEIKTVGSNQVFDIRIKGKGLDSDKKISDAILRIKAKAYDCPSEKDPIDAHKTAFLDRTTAF